eukprot:tig00000350_g24307.t1
MASEVRKFKVKEVEGAPPASWEPQVDYVYDPPNPKHKLFPQLKENVDGVEIFCPSKLAIGLSAMGRPGYMTLNHARDLQRKYDDESMQENMFAVLDAAWVNGVRLFDTGRADAYAEYWMRDWIVSRFVPRDQTIVASKWGKTYMADGKVKCRVHESTDYSLRALRAQHHTSDMICGELGLYPANWTMGLWQVDGVTSDCPIFENKEVLEELLRLKETKRLLIGLTVTGPSQAEAIRKALDAEVKGQQVFDSVQATWNLMERSADAALAEAKQAGLTVILKETMANGRLIPPTTRTTPRAPAWSVGPDAVALAAALEHPSADFVLSGAANLEQFEQNLKALALLGETRGEAGPRRFKRSLREQLGEEAYGALSALQEDPAAYWATHARLLWN